MNEISVYRIDYEIRNTEEREAKMWSACIAAYTQQDAIDYLGAFLRKTFKIIQIGHECRLDALDDKVREKVIQGYLNEQAAAVKKELLKEKDNPQTVISSKDEKEYTVDGVEVEKSEPKPRGKSLKKK
jgi:alpha-galactosidase